jgi:hypothetical protein
MDDSICPMLWLILLFVLTAVGLAAVARSQWLLRRRVDRIQRTLDAVIDVQDRLRQWAEDRAATEDDHAADEHSALEQLVAESRRVATVVDRQHRRILGIQRAVEALRPGGASRTQEFFS